MSGKKCKQCGSSEIEVDPARGDAVCTNCGTVLEDNIIVAEVEFQENAHGGASAIGQFVSAESKGGATGFGRGMFTYILFLLINNISKIVINKLSISDKSTDIIHHV